MYDTYIGNVKHSENLNISCKISIFRRGMRAFRLSFYLFRAMEFEKNRGLTLPVAPFQNALPKPLNIRVLDMLNYRY
jgi:hypothetical protein